MSDAPKRTGREMAAQLVVILILMAILVGAIWFLHDFVSSRSSAPATASTTQVAGNDVWSANVSADGHAAINGHVRAGNR